MIDLAETYAHGESEREMYAYAIDVVIDTLTDVLLVAGCSTNWRSVVLILSLLGKSSSDLAARDPTMSVYLENSEPKPA